MADKLWFGHARGHMQNVPCPLIDSSVTRNRYLERIQFENGGGDGRRSNQYQMQYDFAFSGLAHEVDGIDAFNKFAQGFYGDDLIYLAHPAAFETNLFPAGWATPSLAEKGWGKISTDAVSYSNADGPLVTNLVTNPSMEGVASGTDSTKRTNLVTNPSFETDTTGWTAFSSTVSRITSDYYVGGASAQIVNTAINGGMELATAVATTASATYTVSAWVKGPAGTTLSIGLRERNSGGTSIGFTAASVTATGAWQRLYATRTFGSLGVLAGIEIYNSAITTFYVDAVQLEQSSEVRSYFDGSYSLDSAYIPAWTGTVNNSASTALVRGASNRENLITNPSFEVAVWPSSNPIVSSDSTIFRTGTKSMKLVRSATAGTMTVYQNNGGDSTFPVVGGQNYAHSFWVYSTIASSWRVGSRWQTGVSWGTGFTQTFGSIVSVPANTWTLVSGVLVAPATATYTQLFVETTSTYQTTDSAYIDSVLGEASSVVGDYFDGSYTDAPGWSTSWAGTANASRSVATAAPVTVRTNLVTNPSMETVTPGSVVMRRNLMYNASMISSTGVMPDGMVAYTIGGATGTRTTVSGSSTTSVSAVSLPTTGSKFGHYYSLAAGTLSGLSQAVTVSTVVSGLTGTNISARLYVDFSDAAGWIATATAATTVNGTISATNSTLPRVPTGYIAYIWIESTSGAVTGAAATFSNLLIENGATAGTFFSGATTDALGWDYAWSGTANASISTAACAATTVRTNLAENPSFETGTTWWNTNNATIAQTADPYVGTQSALLTATNGQQFGLYKTISSIAAGQNWAVSGYIKDVNTGRQFQASIEWYNGATFISKTSGTATTVSSSGWTRVSVTGVAPTNTTQMAVTFYSVTNPSIGTQAKYDGMLIEQSSNLGDYFDGSFSPAGDFSYAWTGTANASTSIQRGATIGDWSGGSATAIQARSQKYVGSSSLLVTPTATTGYAALVVPTTVGTSYIFSTWVYSATAKYMRIGTPAALATQVLVPANTWTRLVSASFTATATSSTFTVRSHDDLAPFYVDAVLLEASPIVQDYFDGSVVSADADLTNSWSGTPHASTSLMRGVGVNGPIIGVNAIPVSSGVWKSTGLKSLRIITTATNSTQDLVGLATTVGQTYTAKAKIYIPSTLTGSPTLLFGVRTYGGSTAQHTTPILNQPGEQILSVTYTVSSGATSMSPRVWLNGITGAAQVFVDDLLVVQGTYTGDYFDGDSTDSGNTTYNWTGTANASTSTSLSEMVLYGNPPRATTYTVTNINQPPTKVCTLVIPPEYTLYLGASGTSTGSAGVFIRPIQASDSLYYGPLEELTLLDPNGSVRMNKTLNGATYQAVEVFLMKTDANVGTVTLNSMMAQLYKTGTTPQLPSEHYQGEGSTGLMFADDAIVETYSYMHPPRKGISTTLIEVEAWR